MRRKAKHNEHVSVSWGEMLLFCKFLYLQGEEDNRRLEIIYAEHKAGSTALWFRFLAFKAMRNV
jgi:hypothetical protein